MLQNISYLCIGKGIRKCCSINSLEDPQCMNTEQYYHNTRLDEYDAYQQNDEVYLNETSL
jgi:hypothetical protein